MRSYVKAEVVSERTWLTNYKSPELLTRGTSGGFSEVEPPTLLIPHDMLSTIRRQSYGDVAPQWIEDAGNRSSRGLIVYKVKDVIFYPRFGVLVDASGRVFESTVGEVLSVHPLEKLPFFRLRYGEVEFTAPKISVQMDAAAIFMARGGIANYGHFILDCLTSLIALEKAGFAAVMPLLAPRLRSWQLELIEAARMTFNLETVNAPVLRLGQAAFASSMNHFLHHPTPIILELRHRILSNIKPPLQKCGARVYLSRRKQSRRVMINEAEFERSLSLRGFKIVCPETLSPFEQIRLVQDACVIVGASGAGMANVLFAPHDCHVLEIQPGTFQSHWLLLLCSHVGIRWHGLFVEVNEALRDPHASGYRAPTRSYRLPIAKALAIVDQIS